MIPRFEESDYLLIFPKLLRMWCKRHTEDSFVAEKEKDTSEHNKHN